MIEKMVYSGGPYVTLGTIGSYGSPIGPLNIPYQRVNDTLQQITENILTTFTPWEWWITYVGAVRLASRRGEDKSTWITVTVNKNIGKITKEISTKQTAQRVRVVGRGESSEQDLATSDWFNDEPKMIDVGSFYEVMNAEKTLSSKDESDIVAQVYLYQNSAIRQEITVKLSNNDFTTNDFDVGDDITIEDTDYGISAVYRVKTIENFVDNNGGEETYVTFTNIKTDITKRLTSLQKQLQRFGSSSTFIDRMYGEGSNQTLIDANKIEDVWSQTASNKWTIELPEDEDDDPYLSSCVLAGRGAINWSCDKDEFEVYGVVVNGAGSVMKFEPLLNFSRNPRFTCEFEVDTTGSDRDTWATGDLAYIRIWKRDTKCSGDPLNGDKYCCTPYGNRGFGFGIQKSATQLELYATLNTSTGNRNVKIANIEYDTRYIIEARMEWINRVVEFYFGKPDVEETDEWGFRLRAILPLDRYDTDSDYLCPFHMVLDAASGSTKTAIVIFRWKTQAIRMKG